MSSQLDTGQKIIIAGGGAAGFFTAINVAERCPDCEVVIIEKSNNLLGKVKVSGGGRCNVTNARSAPAELINFYPRGHKKLYPVFQQFSTADMVTWLRQRGVETHTEPDLRMFPVSNSSQTIIDCFLREAGRLGIKVIKNCALTGLTQKDESWVVETAQETRYADKVIICAGASPALWKILGALGLEIVPPVPSLFTFNIDDQRLEGLQGTSFTNATVRMAGTKFQESGPLLITHQGLSGPAILKLSAWCARALADRRYRFSILVNYLPELSSETLRHTLMDEKNRNPKRKVHNHPPGGLTRRFWERLCQVCGIPAPTLYGELSKKHLNKLTEELTQGHYEVQGKSTFKEEFVTCGGVSLSEVDLTTFEARKLRNLYLAGEVLDIDALTGGFNFQACWSAGWIIAKAMSK